MTRSEVWAGLTERHTAELLASGITREVAEQRGYRTVIDKDELLALGFGSYQARVPGLLVPMYSPGAAAAGSGPTSYQFKPDEPRRDRSGRVVKYETPKGATPIIDTHPAIAKAVKDPTVPLVITEGSKKADAGVSRGLTVVSLQGVWTWKHKTLEARDATAVTPDLDEIPLAGRIVQLVFDSDIVDKTGVRDALKRFGAVLTRRGADVRVLRLPGGPDGEKVGLDDYLVENAWDPDRLLDVILTGVVAGDEDDEDEAEFESQADVLKALARKRYTFGFARNYGPFAVDREGPNVAIPMDKAFEYRLFGLYDEADLGTARSEAVRSTVSTLIGSDAMKADEIDALPVRVATMPDRTIVLDMADKTGRAITIDADGWRIVERSPVTFRRTPQMKPLPEPVAGGDLFELFEPFARTEDPETYELLVVWAASLVVENMLHPVLYLTGPSGSGKTTMAIWAKSIIDPSSAPFQRFQDDPKDNLVAASSSWTFIMDNLGETEAKSAAFSDYLSALVTGAGLTARRLYTDSDVISVHLKRAVILTSVEVLPFAEDLWQRTIHVEVPVFLEGRDRLTDLDALFARRHGAMLGAALDLVVAALRAMTQVDTSTLTRLRFTDFAAFLGGVDLTYGTSALQTYVENLDATVEDAAAFSPFVRAIELLVDEAGGEWEGEPLDLVRELSRVASLNGLGNAAPDSAVVVGRTLTRETHPLARRGIAYRRFKSDGRRKISLYRIGGGGPTGTDDGPTGTDDGPTGTDDLASVPDLSLYPSLKKANGDRGFSATGTDRTDKSGKVHRGSLYNLAYKDPTGREEGPVYPSYPSLSEQKPRSDGIFTGTDTGTDDLASVPEGTDTVPVTLTADSAAVLDALSAAEVRTRADLEAITGRRGTRLEKPLGYLIDAGLVAKVRRTARPDLVWPARASTGYVLTGRPYVAVEPETGDLGEWVIDETDLALWTLIDREAPTVTCRRCAAEYERPLTTFLTACPSCFSSIIP